MTPSSSPQHSTPGPAAGAPESPSVSPVFPLLLLETMRDRDRPEELLEDEDPTQSLPRRLGLSEVVRLQIQKFTQEVKLKRPQVPSQVEDLIRLVIRRADAEEIFTEAGRRVASRFYSERSGWARGLVRFLPRPLALIAAQRAARKMFSRIVGPARFRVSRRPVTLTIDNSLTARADPGGAACAFYAGAFAEALELYTGRRYRVNHPSCAARTPGSPCEWTVEIAG